MASYLEAYATDHAAGFRESVQGLVRVDFDEHGTCGAAAPAGMDSSSSTISTVDQAVSALCFDGKNHKIVDKFKDTNRKKLPFNDKLEKQV